jgi:hypothetical protein
MVAFYIEERAEDVDLTADGDMLLFQWGTYDWGDGPSFQYDITRQLVESGRDDPDIWQLSLTAHFVPTRDTIELGSGNRWYPTVAQSAELLEFVRDHPTTAYVEGTTPDRVELDFGRV